MEETGHLVAQFMAAGAEQRLEDYHFLKHTYETISDQETQLNRILRMLGEDEIVLNWHIDTTPIDRARHRSLHDFDRFGDPKYLPGRIAYERLREMEQEDFKKRPAPPVSSRRSYASRPKSNEQDDQSSLSNGTSSSTPSAARLRALAEYEAELAEAEAQRQRQKAEKLRALELISFAIRYEDSSTSGDDGNSLGRLICEWISPSSSSDIDYFLIERQLGDQQWLPIEKEIDKSKSEVQLDISSLLFEEKNQNLPSRFRLKAQLENGKQVTSKPSDEINLSLLVGKHVIIPNVEILSSNSVQLTWANDENDPKNVYDIEKKEANETQWTKVLKVPLAQGSAQIENLTDARQCQFRLMPRKSSLAIEDIEPEMLTVHNVNEWLGSLRLVPTSINAVDVDISEEGFKEFDLYKVEYTTIDQLDQWKQVPDITRDAPHLTINNLKPDTDYKFRFTPILRGATTANETTSSQLSLVLDVKMPSSRKGRLVKNEAKTPAPPPQFAIHQTDPTSVLIEAIIPSDKPASFDDVFDVYTKKETNDDQWTKVGSIDKDHLNIVMKNLAENTSYAFKIVNQASSDEQNIIQQFNFETASVKLYDPSLFLSKIEQSLESVVNGVMRAAAGHQVLEDPVNISLNEVIREIFQDETLVPNEQYGFDTLALSNDLQLFRGPKQMMLQELDGKETSESSKKDGEIIIHNYRHANREQQPVIVREENGNTRVGNIDGDVIVRNVVTDVLLTNEETRNQLSMNIVGQAFLKGVQGILIASKFKGIIVVKNVMKIENN